MVGSGAKSVRCLCGCMFSVGSGCVLGDSFPSGKGNSALFLCCCRRMHCPPSSLVVGEALLKKLPLCTQPGQWSACAWSIQAPRVFSGLFKILAEKKGCGQLEPLGILHLSLYILVEVAGDLFPPLGGDVSMGIAQKL